MKRNVHLTDSYDILTVITGTIIIIGWFVLVVLMLAL